MASVSLSATAELDEDDVVGWMLDGDLSLWLLLAGLAGFPPEKIRTRLVEELTELRAEGALAGRELAPLRTLVEALQDLTPLVPAETEPA